MNCRIKFFFVIVIFFVTVFLGHSQQKVSRLEVTKIDITKIQNFKSNKVTVFDVCLGMPMSVAKDRLFANSSIFVATNTKEPLNVKIYDKTPDGKMRNLLVILSWESVSGGLKEIKLLKDFKPYLVGNAQMLLSAEAVNPNSYICKSFLGRPSKTENNNYTSFINIITTIYTYGSKGVKVEKQNVDGKINVDFSLVSF